MLAAIASTAGRSSAKGKSDAFTVQLQAVSAYPSGLPWHLASHSHTIEGMEEKKAYDRVWRVMRERKSDWAVSEHMAFNGSDYVSYTDTELKQILFITLKQGIRFGWELVNVDNSKNSFNLYNEDWALKG